MYLPDKITKILGKVETAYTVHYRGNKISLIETEEKSAKIYATSSGCRMDVKGFSVNLRDLESLEKLLIKFGIATKQKNKVKVIKLKEDVSAIFAETKKEIAIKYYKGCIVSVLVKEPHVAINKTEFGYKIKMGSKEIAVEDVNSIRVFLEKMNVIPVIKGKKGKKNKETSDKNKVMPGVEQLMLEI